MEKDAPAKRTRSQIGKLSRNKGKTFERTVASDLREIYGEHIKRGWQAREGHDAPDVEGTPFWVECKHMIKVPIQAAYTQAREAATKAGSALPPLVVAKDNGGQPLAVLSWAHFLELLVDVQDAQTAKDLIAREALEVSQKPGKAQIAATVFIPAQPKRRR